MENILSLLVKGADLCLKISKEEDGKSAYKQIEGRLKNISSEISTLSAKHDQEITKEIGAAFEAIENALITTNIDTKKIYLSFAEQSLLRNTTLNKNLSTSGNPNTYWMAIAHYGLAIISALREDNIIATRHILKMYINDPRNARLNYAPNLFDSLLKKECSTIFNAHNSIIKHFRNTFEEMKKGNWSYLLWMINQTLNPKESLQNAINALEPNYKAPYTLLQKKYITDEYKKYVTMNNPIISNIFTNIHIFGIAISTVLNIHGFNFNNDEEETLQNNLDLKCIELANNYLLNPEIRK